MCDSVGGCSSLERKQFRHETQLAINFDYIWALFPELGNSHQNNLDGLAKKFRHLLISTILSSPGSSLRPPSSSSPSRSSPSSFSGSSSGSRWTLPTRSWITASSGPRTPWRRAASSSATSRTCPSFAPWVTPSCWWWRARFTPSRREACPKPSMRPSPSDLPCTPPASSGWRSYPSSLARRSLQRGYVCVYPTIYPTCYHT